MRRVKKRAQYCLKYWGCGALSHPENQYPTTKAYRGAIPKEAEAKTVNIPKIQVREKKQSHGESNGKQQRANNQGMVWGPKTI